MTHIDLLNYLTDVQKIEKSDLAELIGVPQKKIDGVLCGQIPLKKKWLKNLSLYTNIPTEAILTGNFVIEYPQTPDGEPAPVLDVYVPEAIREENTRRLNLYSKKRYKSDYQDVVLIKILGIFNLAMSWIIPLGLMYIYSINAVSDLVKIMLLGIIPALIGVSILRNVYKFAKNGVTADEKTFKYYGALSIVQLLIFIISLVVFKWTSPVALVAMILIALPVFYEVFIVKDKDLTFLKHTLVSVICVVASLALALLWLTGEKADSIENETQAIIFIGLFSSGWLSTYFSFANVLICKYYYCKRKGISKHFGAVSKKKVFKSSKIAKSVISLVLVGVIIFSALYVAPVIAFDKIISSAFTLPGDDSTETEYLDYDKTDIFFAENEEVVLIEQENYRFKLPIYMERKTEAKMSEIYQNIDKMSSLIIEDVYLDFDELLFDGEDESKREYNERLKNSIIERYGFFPKGEYEYYKLMRLISEDTINPFNRDLSTAVSILSGMEQWMGNEKVYFYEDSEKGICVRVHSFKRDDGKTTFFYYVSGNAKGDHNKFVCFNIIVVTELSDMDLPYKIINSIEMK